MERRTLCHVAFVGLCALLTGCQYSGNGLWLMGEGLNRKRRQQELDVTIPSETTGGRQPAAASQEPPMQGRDE
jgi:hypothetical protein